VTKLRYWLFVSQSHVAQSLSLPPVFSRLNTDALEAVGGAMDSVSQSLTFDANELADRVAEANTDLADARDTGDVLGWFYQNLHREAYGIGRQSLDYNAQLAAKASTVNLIRERMGILAGCRYQLPPGVLSVAVDRLLGPVAWFVAIDSLLEPILEDIRRLLSRVGILEVTAMSRRLDFRLRLREACRLNLRLRCTCTRLQHLW